MDAIDRRGALRILLCGAVAAGLGASLLSVSAEAMPLAMEKDLGKKAAISKMKHKPWRPGRGLGPFAIPGAIIGTIIVGGAAAGSAGGTEDVATVDGDGGDDH